MTRRQAREQAFTLIFEKSFHPEITVEEMISMAVEARYLQTDEFAVLQMRKWCKNGVTAKTPNAEAP